MVLSPAAFCHFPQGDTCQSLHATIVSSGSVQSHAKQGFRWRHQGLCYSPEPRYRRGCLAGSGDHQGYTALHHQGFAASVEVWEKQEKGTDDRLVGGLYGVNLGRAFFGESMFSLVPNASKFALIYLARIFDHLGGLMIDCQLETPHLRSMGGRFIPYEEYIALIRRQ